MSDFLNKVREAIRTNMTREDCEKHMGNLGHMVSSVTLNVLFGAKQ